MKRIYFDNNATTKPDARVVQKVFEQAQEIFGNPSSLHYEGQQAKRLLEESRRIIAEEIGARPDEIVFTSGGTEANNLAIKGVAEVFSEKGNHLLTSSIEHQSIKSTHQYLERKGYKVSWIPVDNNGVIDLELLEKSLRPDTILVSVMLANNELGTIQPVKQAAKIAHKKGIYFHCDAVQALGKMPVKVDELGVDLMSISAHKIYAFKGIGALYIRKGTKLTPQTQGGHQEKNRRSGTENLPGILSFAEAIKIFQQEKAERIKRMSLLREKLENGLKEKFGFARINAELAPRIPNTTSVSFPGFDGEILLLNLDAMGIAVSTGSACRAGMTEPSYVLQAIGLSKEEAQGTLRISLGKDNTDEEVDYFLDALGKALEKIKRGD